MKNNPKIIFTKLNILIIISCISLPFYAQDSVKQKWFDFSVQSSLIINNSFSNYYDSESYTLGNYHYVQNLSAKTNKLICYGYVGGLNVQIGKSQDVKQLIGLYVDYTNSYFNVENTFKAL